MTAFYLTATSQDLLVGMLVGIQGNMPVMLYQNVIGPLPATPAIAAGSQGIDANGNPFPAQNIPAAGVPGQYYMSINIPNAATFPVPYPNGVTEDDINGQAVLGVWA